MLYPSDVVASALNLAPDPQLPVWGAESLTHCSHCAAPIATGDHFQPLNAGVFFSSTRDLATASRVVCWRCVHVRAKTLLNGLSYALICPDAIYSIAKDTEKAWLFLETPEPPFVVVHSSSTMQHLVWRTPVTLSKDLIQVRFGDNLFVVRPKVVKEAISRAEDVTDRSGADWMNPLLLDRKVSEGYHGLLNPKAAQFLTDSDREFFTNRVGPGERWALAYICHSKRPQPQRPEIITDKIAEKHKG